MVRIVVKPTITTYIHPVDTTIHPTYPSGYRWAIHLGDDGPTNINRCIQAGHSTTMAEAEVARDSHAAAVCVAVTMFGIGVRLEHETLTSDPIPAEADALPLKVVRGN